MLRLWLPLRDPLGPSEGSKEAEGSLGSKLNRFERPLGHACGCSGVDLNVFAIPMHVSLLGSEATSESATGESK